MDYYLLLWYNRDKKLEKEKVLVMLGLDKEGLEEEIEQGINSSKIEIVKNMLKESQDLEFISRVTNLSVSEINK